jgi:hypothetical protein
MNDRQEISEGLHTIVVDQSVASIDEAVSLFHVPAGYYVRFGGEMRLLTNGNLSIAVIVERALPNGCRP